jgi:chorismate mutase/prephenate dehydratase
MPECAARRQSNVRDGPPRALALIMATAPGDADLAVHRNAIDALDREILARLNARAEHARAIGALKAGGVVYRPEREAQVLARLQGENRGPLSNEAVAGVFRQVMSACMALEQPLRIAYLGPAGTFSHAAVAKHFGQFVMGEPCATIDEVFRAVESGQTDYAVVPVENSTEGAVGRTLDLMCQTPLQICGEVKLRVTQNLLANVGSFGEVNRVYSHAQSLAQCVLWLAKHLPGVPRIAVASNAEAPRRSPGRSQPRSTASRCWRRTSRTSPTTRRASGCSAGRRFRRRARTRPRW